MMRSVRAIGTLVILVVLLGLLGYWALYWPLRDPQPVRQPLHGGVALLGQELAQHGARACGARITRKGRSLIEAPTQAVNLFYAF
jgi:hypothetical protein